MPLSAVNIAVLNRASRSAIGQTMIDLQQHWLSGRWLPTSNAYKSNPLSQLSSDATGAWSPNHKSLREYIAASSLVHCYDGWSFLGRAFEAELSGDPDTARHLGYYAELRGSMSLLASNGIGVFNTQHVIVNNSRNCEKVGGGGTHNFAWDALVHWGASTQGVSTVLSSVRPGSIPLQEWFDHYPASFSNITTSWLRDWGLDLSRLTDDRAARNNASYRPTAFTTAGPAPIETTVHALLRFWKLFEPNGIGEFPILDSHLLLRALEVTFRQSHSNNRSRHQAKLQYKQKISQMLHGVNPSGMSLDRWESFLTSARGVVDFSLLEDASQTTESDHIDHSRQVLARATLLLRVATGSVAEQLRGISEIGDKLGFWIEKPSTCHRMWPVDTPPDSSIDLWPDVEIASQAVSDWINNESHPSHFQLLQSCGANAINLSATERAALWGLGL